MGDAQDLLKAQSHIWHHTFNFINSMSLKCAIELSIPETIRDHGSPMTLPELVANLTISPSKALHVGRLMRILAHAGFFALQKLGNDREGYVLTHSSRLLLKDNPYSVAPFVLAVLDPRMTKPGQCLSSWFQNDDVATPFETAHGMALWECMAREAEVGGLFNEGMASDSILVASVVSGPCKDVFEGVRMLVDVGGGTGTMAKALVDAFSDMECVVFDLPHVVEGLGGSVRLKFVGGDMFEAIPPADAILLKWILHDWDDDECIKILKKCKEAIANGGGGKVIIIDMIVERKNKDEESYETQLLFDGLMMTLASGKERDEKNWSKLFSNAGFSSYKINPILGLRSLIELYP